MAKFIQMERKKLLELDNSAVVISSFSYEVFLVRSEKFKQGGSEGWKGKELP
jgi:hypothetical protein